MKRAHKRFFNVGFEWSTVTFVVFMAVLTLIYVVLVVALSTLSAGCKDISVVNNFTTPA